MAKLNGDRMRYQTNKSSFWLCIIAVIFNVASLINIYENKTIEPDVYIGLDILINIVIMLVGFWGAEKTKTYKRYWSYILIVFGLIQILRIFVVPLKFFIVGQMTFKNFMLNVCFLVLSAVALFASAVICFIKSTVLKAHMETVTEKSFS